MNPALLRGPVVIDTDVFSAHILPSSRPGLAERFAPVIADRPAFVSFQTVMELRFGALRRGWGAARMLRLETTIRRAEIVHTGPELVMICAQLRADCERVGHALGQREHNADRWIAATAMRIGVPLVSNDGIFRDVPGLALASTP